MKSEEQVWERIEVLHASYERLIQNYRRLISDSDYRSEVFAGVRSSSFGRSAPLKFHTQAEAIDAKIRQMTPEQIASETGDQPGKLFFELERLAAHLQVAINALLWAVDSTEAEFRRQIDATDS